MELSSKLSIIYLMWLSKQANQVLTVSKQWLFGQDTVPLWGPISDISLQCDFLWIIIMIIIIIVARTTISVQDIFCNKLTDQFWGPANKSKMHVHHCSLIFHANVKRIMKKNKSLFGFCWGFFHGFWFCPAGSQFPYPILLTSKKSSFLFVYLFIHSFGLIYWFQHCSHYSCCCNHEDFCSHHRISFTYPFSTLGTI